MESSVTLGDLLRLNPGLARLGLEWNCLGHDPEAFAQFCSGLAANTNLEILDLRSQQQPQSKWTNLVTAECN